MRRYVVSLPPVTVTTPLGEGGTEWRRERSAVRSLLAAATSGRSPAQVPRMSDSSIVVVTAALIARKRYETSAAGICGSAGGATERGGVGAVGGGDLGGVGWSVVVGVGSADVREAVRSAFAAPRNDEHRAAILRNGYDDRDLVAHERPRHRDVDALGGPDGRRVRAVVEEAHLVGPHAGRVHDRAGPHVELGTVSADARGLPAPGTGLRDPEQRRVVHDRRAEVGGGLRNREREPGIVGLRVVIHVRRGDVVDGQRRHVAQRLVLAHALVELPDAQPPGEV